MFAKFITFVLALANLSSFAQTAQSAQPANTDAKAQVYIYRYKQFVGSALAPSVYCDEVQLARMENGRYFLVNVDPGSHSFRSNDAQSGIALDAKAGQQYFIRVDIATGMLKGHGRLTLTAPEQGRYELKSSKMKPLDSDRVLDKARVSTEPVSFETPVPAAMPVSATSIQTQPKLVAAPQKGAEAPVHEVTLSDEQAGTDQQMSLGEAARQAKQKKVESTKAPQSQ